MRRTVLQVLVLVAAAFAAGFASNAVRASLDPAGDSEIFLKFRLEDVSIDAASKALEDPATLFLDVRPQADYQAAHIRGAVSFSSDDFEAAWAEVRDFLGDGVSVIVYGEEELPAARAAQFLSARGHQGRVLEDGFTAWQRRGLPVEGAP
jgi:rhodanese-related sulfurtransferase